MKWRLFIGIALAIVLVVCGWLVYRGVFSNEELASKPEWSIVQSVEFQNRDKPSDKIEVVKMDEYSLLKIPVADERKKVWVLLNPRHPPYYKQIPQGSYRLSKEDLKNILSFGGVASTVANCLESHVEEAQ